MQKSKLLLLFYMITTTQLGFAQVLSEQPSLEQLAGDAELIFEGTLTDLQYRDSAEGMPHTFATYKVDSVLKGFYQKPSITLRFVGGYKNGGKSDVRLIVSHGPKFDRDEKGIMLVSGENGNAGSICPLVGCNKGRFLMKGAHVTNGEGALVTTDAGGKPNNRSKGLADNDHNTVAMSRDSFVSHLRGIIGKQRSEKGFSDSSSRRTVHSADLYIPFAGPKAVAEAGPSEDESSLQSNEQKLANASKGKSDFDRWEEEQLRQSGGNPVLPNNQYSGSR